MSGLEAIGVAASIIQVADLGATLSVKLFSFYQRVKSASDSIQLLSSEIALVSAILRELGDNLKKEDAAKLCSAEAFRTLNLVLDQSRDILNEIKKVVDDHDQSANSRFQQVTGKFRIALREPNLDRLKISLERLKSTMLLLLNVITYAGQIRSQNFPTLFQEQRDLIENLLGGRDVNNQKPRELDMTADSRSLSTHTTYRTSRHPRTKRALNQKHTPTKHRPTVKHQNFPLDELPSISSSSPKIKVNKATGGKGYRSLDSLAPINRSNASFKVERPTKHNTSTEVAEYDILIRNMLNEIESCRSKLEKSRHSRIKNGVLNIHSGEVMRFHIEHGSSLNVDYSLFNGNEETSSNSCQTTITSPILAVTDSNVHYVHLSNFVSDSAESSVDHYSDSEDSDFSETDISIRRQSDLREGRRRRREKDVAQGVIIQTPWHTDRSNSQDNNAMRGDHRMRLVQDGAAIKSASRRHSFTRGPREDCSHREHHQAVGTGGQRLLERNDIAQDPEIPGDEVARRLERLERLTRLEYESETDSRRGASQRGREPELLQEEDERIRIKVSKRRSLERVRPTRQPVVQRFSERKEGAPPVKPLRDTKTKQERRADLRERLHRLERRERMDRSEEEPDHSDGQAHTLGEFGEGSSSSEELNDITRTQDPEAKIRELRMLRYRKESHEDEGGERLRRVKRRERMERFEGQIDSELRWRLKRFKEEEEEEQKRKREMEMKRIAVEEWEIERRRLKQEGKEHHRDEGDTSSSHQTHEPSSPQQASSESASGQFHDFIHRQTISEDQGLDLPGTVEDLLAQWTTLDKEEIRRIQRGQRLSFF